MPPTLFAPLLGRVSGASAAAWDVGDLATRQLAEGRDIIHLGVGDPDMDIAPVVLEATTRALAAGRTHYSPLGGEPVLRDAIARHATGLYRVEVAPSEVAVCSGAQGALFSVFQLIAGPGDEVIVLSPFYATYPAVVTAGGAKMVAVELLAEQDFHLDIARVEAAITPRTRAILINSPSNPTGRVLTPAEIDAVVTVARSRDLWLVSDEVYWSLCYDSPHISPFSQRREGDRIVVINSVSKSHAMPGFRIGWMIGPQDLIAAVTILAQSVHFGINPFAQDAAAVALADPTIPDGVRAVFRERRDALVAALQAIDGLRFSAPEGGMFLLVDVSATGLAGGDFAAGLLEAQGVATVPGFGFGEAVAHMIRIGFLPPPQRLGEAAVRIEAFVRGLRRKA